MMLRTSLLASLMAGMSVGYVVSPAQAQTSGSGPATVSSVGNETVKLKPAELRMTIQLSEKGATLKEVLAKLKTRCDAAKLQIAQLAATKESILVTEPEFAGDASNRELQMRQMMAMRNARGGRVPKGLTTPKTVTVTANLAASWPLTGKSAEEVLFLSHELQTKIEAADLAGLNEKKQLTPEEEELAAEAQEFTGFSSNGEPTPGQPQFFFVGRISEERRDQATQAAFAKAKSQAQRLAKAAGSELGKLSSLSSHATQSSDGSSYSNYGMSYALMRQAQLAGAQSDEEQEAISPTAGEVNFQVVVQAAFELK
jgi:uncharacterized protein YggE